MIHVQSSIHLYNYTAIELQVNGDGEIENTQDNNEGYYEANVLMISLLSQQVLQ